MGFVKGQAYKVRDPEKLEYVKDLVMRALKVSVSKNSETLKQALELIDTGFVVTSTNGSGGVVSAYPLGGTVRDSVVAVSSISLIVSPVWSYMTIVPRKFVFGKCYRIMDADAQDALGKAEGLPTPGYLLALQNLVGVMESGFLATEVNEMGDVVSMFTPFGSVSPEAFRREGEVDWRVLLLADQINLFCEDEPVNIPTADTGGKEIEDVTADCTGERLAVLIKAVAEMKVLNLNVAGEYYPISSLSDLVAALEVVGTRVLVTAKKKRDEATAEVDRFTKVCDTLTAVLNNPVEGEE